jgi:ABC-type multidrug transport system ATPase subunit
MGAGVASKEEHELISAEDGQTARPVSLKWSKINYFIDLPDARSYATKAKDFVSRQAISTYGLGRRSGWSRVEGENSSSAKRQHRQLLHNVHGSAEPGTSLAIMGPSGAGKTTMLDILSFRQSKGSIHGKIEFNGTPASDIEASLPRLIGYVPQQDCVIQSLTVREALWVVAQLRLPSHLTADERVVRVQGVIDDLGLTKVALSKSTMGQLNMSGGEIKKVCIGIELVTRPSILLLDEPTSGLSSGDALSVMSTVQNVCVKRKLAVISSIHQPRREVFCMFDKMLLLSLGRVMYFGAVSNISPYFRGIGRSCPLGFNIADWILDVTTPPRPLNDVQAGEVPPPPFPIPLSLPLPSVPPPYPFLTPTTPSPNASSGFLSMVPIFLTQIDSSPHPLPFSELTACIR